MGVGTFRDLAMSLFRILVSKGHAEKDGIAVLKLYDPADSV